MEIMWSPWRSKYIGTFKEDTQDLKKECFICRAIKESPEEDESNLLLHKSNNVVIMLNKFPYNNGHVLIAPVAHQADILEIPDEIDYAMIKIRKIVLQSLKEIYKPHGFNIGANIGRGAGAGLPDHIHYHVVPRWNGDTSFTAVVSDYKVVSISLEDTYRELKRKLYELGINKID